VFWCKHLWKRRITNKQKGIRIILDRRGTAAEISLPVALKLPNCRKIFRLNSSILFHSNLFSTSCQFAPVGLVPLWRLQDWVESWLHGFTQLYQTHSKTYFLCLDLLFRKSWQLFFFPASQHYHVQVQCYSLQVVQWWRAI